MKYQTGRSVKSEIRIAYVLAATALLTSCGDSATDPDPVIELVCTIPADELFGAAARDAIPALTNPEITDAAASFMVDTDRILGIEVNGQARAYPMGILWYHEVMNDTLGGEQILLTYCPLTGSGLGFDPHVGGQLRDFGVSGVLYRSNLVMFDSQTQSLWNQMSLGSQCGLDRGTELQRISVMETDWAYWKSEHPNTTVVTPNTGFQNRAYFSYPYGDYDDPGNAFVDFLPPGTTWSNERLPKELVMGVFDGSQSKAYPLMAMADSGVSFVVNDVVGSTPVLVTSQSQWNTAQAFDRRVNGQELTFTVTNPGPLELTDAETGTTWNALGQATAGPLLGSRLKPLTNAFVAFWFAWSIYYPNTIVFE